MRKPIRGIKNANNTLIKDERMKWYTDVQQAYTEDVPAIPLFNRTETYATSAALEGFAPTNRRGVLHLQRWRVGTPRQRHHRPRLHPGTGLLFGLVESAAVAHMTRWHCWAPMQQAGHYPELRLTSPYHLVDIPTIEAGRATNADVEVKAGDMVLDATGNRGRAGMPA